MLPPSSSLTILVTGGSGFIGKAIVQLLLQEGYRVRVLSREGSPWPPSTNPHLERSLGDMCNASSLLQATKGVSAVIHLAARKNDESDSEEVNVRGAQHLIHACTANSVPLIVNISTQSAKLARKGVYGSTKARADTLFQTSSLHVITLRCSLVYGGTNSGVFTSLQRFASLPVVPVFGSGEARFHPIHKDDLARIILALLHNSPPGNHIFDAGGPEAIRFNQLIQRIMAMKGTNRPLLHLPIWCGLLLAHVCSILPRPPLTVSNVLGGAEDIAMNIQPLVRTTGYTPRSFTEELTKMAHAQHTINQEARSLFAYLLAAAPSLPPIDHTLCERYAQALVVHDIPSSHHLDVSTLSSRVLLGGLDVLTRMRYPRCTLQRKLLIAAALLETHPLSADWLLPHDHSFFSLLVRVLRACLRIAGKVCVALVLLFSPSFVQRNAG